MKKILKFSNKGFETFKKIRFMTNVYRHNKNFCCPASPNRAILATALLRNLRVLNRGVTDHGTSAM